MLSIETFILYFSTGLLGGFGHCIGMCGPVVIAYTGLFSHPSRIIPHLLYNLGRTTTYAFLGAIVAITGSLISSISTLQRALMLLTASAMILSGIMIMIHRWNFSSLSIVTETVKKTLSFIGRERNTGILFPFGIIMGFVPCGLVYTMLIGIGRLSLEDMPPVEAMAGSMGLMAVFSIGTSVALVLTAMVSGLLTDRLRKRLYSISGLLMAAAGAVLLWRSLWV